MVCYVSFIVYLIKYSRFLNLYVNRQWYFQTEFIRNFQLSTTIITDNQEFSKNVSFESLAMDFLFDFFFLNKFNRKNVSTKQHKFIVQ